MKTVTVKTKNHIISILKDNNELLNSFGIKKIGIFGSFVREEQTGESDVDLLAEFDNNLKTFDNFMNASFFWKRC